MKEQELRLIALVEGFDQAAGQVDKVGEAERKLATDTLASADASDEARAAAQRIVDLRHEQTVTTEETRAATQSLAGAQAQATAEMRALTRASEELASAKQRLAQLERELAESSRGGGLLFKPGLMGGVEQAKADVEKLAAAEVAARERAEAAQGKLTASTEAYTSLLSRVHPSLGAFADALVKGSQIAGDLATKEIHLGEITEKVTEIFEKNSKAIGLLGSAGVAAIGFTALAKSIAWVCEESKKLEERLDALEERKTGEQRDVMAGEQRIIDQARGRREGAAGAEEAAGMREMYQQFRRADRIPPELLAELEKNIALLYGQATKEMIEAITLGGGEGIDAGMSGETRGRRAGPLAERVADEAARSREEYRARQAHAREAALREGRDPDITAGRAHYDDMVKDQTQLADPELVKQIVDRVLEKRRTPGTTFGRASGDRFSGWSIENQVETALSEHMGFFGSMWEAAAPGVENALARQEATRTLQQLDRQPPVVINNTIHMQNSRNTYPDAKAQRRATKNGENHMARVGDG